MLTKKYQYSADLVKQIVDKNNDVKIEIVEGDMFDIAQQHYLLFKKRNLNEKIAIHNFANNERPGLYKKLPNGQIYFKTNTQEEQLLRASLVNGQHYLGENNYPITANIDLPCALLSENILFDKDPMTGNEKQKKNMMIANVITCALPNKPAVLNGNYRNKKMRDIVLKHMILCLSISSDADIFITGMWGIGAFRHPIEEIVPLWLDAIKLTRKCPKNIVFVVYNDKFKQQVQETFKKYRIL